MAAKTVSIPVKVVPNSSRRAPAATPVAHTTTKKTSHRKPRLVRTRRMSSGVSAAPIEQRRRWMWGFVVVGMLIAVSLWGMSLGSELHQTDSHPGFVSELSKLFHGFQLNPKDEQTPKQQEIQKLEQQVFPQFE